MGASALAAQQVNLTTLLLLGGVVLLIVVALVGAAFLSSRGGGDSGMKRDIVDAPLHMTLRFLAEDKATLQVHVVTKNLFCDLYMRDGRLVHAADGQGETGDRAVSEALRWDTSVTTLTVIEGGATPPERSVTMPLEDLFRAAGVRN